MATSTRHACEPPCISSMSLNETRDQATRANLEKKLSANSRTQGLNVTHVTGHQTATSSEGFSVHTWAGGDAKFFWGLASTQGRRPDMEDAHAVDLAIDKAGTALFGMFDGHAGKEVAAYCARHIREVVVAQPSFAAGKLSDALGDAFLALEARMNDPATRAELLCLRQGIAPQALSKHPSVAEGADDYGIQDQAGSYRGPQAGATACVALMSSQGQLCVASVGDSRCVLSDSGRALCLTRDHKAKDPAEARRIQKAGLAVVNNRVCTESSSLAMTRALGDTKYKQAGLSPEQQAVTPVPDTTCAAVDVLAGGAAGSPEAKELGTADFMVLACDGLWDCMSNQQAITFVAVGMDKGLTPQQAAQALVEEALSANSVTPATRDNVTVMVVQFAPLPSCAM